MKKIVKPNLNLKIMYFNKIVDEIGKSLGRYFASASLFLVEINEFTVYCYFNYGPVILPYLYYNIF